MLSKSDSVKYHGSECKCGRFSVLVCKCCVFNLPQEFPVCSSDNVTVICCFFRSQENSVKFCSVSGDFHVVPQ